MEGNGNCLVKVLSRYFPTGIELNKESSLSGECLGRNCKWVPPKHKLEASLVPYS
jgi:hypothetical protein